MRGFLEDGTDVGLVQQRRQAFLDVDVRGRRLPSADPPIQKTEQNNRVSGHSKHLADAIIRYLDWRERGIALKQERKQRAIAKAARTRAERKANIQQDNIVVEVPAVERPGRVLANDWRAILQNMEAQIHDRQGTH